MLRRTTWWAKFYSAVSSGIWCEWVQGAGWVGGEGEWSGTINAALMPSIKTPDTECRVSGGVEQQVQEIERESERERGGGELSISICCFYPKDKYSVAMYREEGCRGGGREIETGQ